MQIPMLSCKQIWSHMLLSVRYLGSENAIKIEVQGVANCQQTAKKHLCQGKKKKICWRHWAAKSGDHRTLPFVSRGTRIIYGNHKSLRTEQSTR
jgi:hypothetical protein